MTIVFAVLNKDYIWKVFYSYNTIWRLMNDKAKTVQKSNSEEKSQNIENTYSIFKSESELSFCIE